MSDDAIRLDGNAAAGALAEVFSVEMTAAVCACNHCGSSRSVGTTLAYMGGPGTVLRCVVCGDVVIRFARVRGRLVVDLTGVRRLELPANGETGETSRGPLGR